MWSYNIKTEITEIW